MAQKRKPTSRKKPPAKRRRGTQKKSGSSFGRFLLGILILAAMAYGVLAYQDGKLVPDIISEFALKVPDLEKEQEESKEEPKTAPKKELQAPEEKSLEKPEVDLEGFDLYFTKAFDFMWPDYEADQSIIERPYYTLRYSEEHEQALWVAYQLVADSLQQDKFERGDDFREDPRIRTGSASLTDYRRSGYDRGHLAPAADFSYDEFALSQSFYMSNMSPQDPSFNRGIWRELEEQVRDWAMENQSVFVVTGPVLNKAFKTIGSNKVSIPEYYYKIVLDIRKPDIKAIAFLMKNEKSSAELSSFVVSIDELELLTQLDFFPTISDDLEELLESRIITKGWFN